MTTCALCGADNPPAHRFCDRCGGPFESPAHRESPSRVRTLRIGRAHEMEICLDPDAQQVSRHHADVVEYPDGRLELIDRGSANHTYLNGQELTPDVPHRFALTDTIEFGSYRFNTALVREQLHYDALDVRPSAGPMPHAEERPSADPLPAPVEPAEAPAVGAGGMSSAHYGLLALIAMLVIAVIFAAMR